MKNRIIQVFITATLVLGLTLANAQDRQLVLNESGPNIKIQPTMYGIFFEDINFAADGGLYAEMVKNRSFEFLDPKMGWIEPKSDRHSFNTESGIASIVKYSGKTTNHNYAKIKVKNASGYTLINNGFRGMGIKEGAVYNLSFYASEGEGDIANVNVAFIDEEGNELGSTTVTPEGKIWKEYEAKIIATKTLAKAKLKITFEGTGILNMDMISLFPEDTWKGRKKGLRKDLVQLLDDMDPGFLRFPGGCIVEGRTLAQRYQWKKTIGPILDRELLINGIQNLIIGQRQIIFKVLV